LSDVQRFEELVLPHLDSAYNLARWLTRDSQDAQDVVQEACVRALKYVASLTGRDAKAWFLTIVRNAFYDWLARNRPGEVVADENNLIESVADDETPGPEQLAVRNAELRLLSDAVSALPAQYREVLILRELEELSYKEIASAVDIPIGTVMSRLARARMLLQHSPSLYAVRSPASRSAS
jgi:RNA polymerase sigma-70 factor (ECF subfamily)